MDALGEDPPAGLRLCRQPGSVRRTPNLVRGPRPRYHCHMCNAYEQHVKWVEYTRMMQDLELGIPTQQTELDLPQSDMVRINDMAPVMRAAENLVELVPMNFSFAPSGPKGGPVFNFRSEGRDFSNSGRCLIPASGFFEFTGANIPKTKHRFTLGGFAFSRDRRLVARGAGQSSGELHDADHLAWP